MYRLQPGPSALAEFFPEAAEMGDVPGSLVRVSRTTVSSRGGAPEEVLHQAGIDGYGPEGEVAELGERAQETDELLIDGSRRISKFMADFQDAVNDLPEPLRLGLKSGERESLIHVPTVLRRGTFCKTQQSATNC